MQELISIDLGSNSFRVLKYDCVNKKSIIEHNEVVGLADGLIKTGEISKNAQQRVIDAILKTIKKFNYNPSKAIAVTTAAMRKAKNSQSVLDTIYKKTGVDFHIIDGNEEARLTLLAVKYALQRESIDSSKFILLDIGGGSTELIVSTKDNYIAKSFDFGIVTMTQGYIHAHDLQNDLDKRKEEVKSFLDDLELDLQEYNFVATAGTPTTVAALKLGQDFFSYDKEEVNGTTVNLDDLQSCLTLLKNSSKDEVVKLVGSGRVEFIEVGVFIYQAIFEVLEKTQSIVLDDGLREGVAINECIKKCKD
ncbi:MAG: exopolyphosphatase [Campylobacterota bacterium]